MNKIDKNSCKNNKMLPDVYMDRFDWWAAIA
jgi:hypothetical protein